MLRLSRRICLLTLLLIAICSEAQYKADHIPGFVGLQAGSQPPPGVYLGNLVWVYHTDTVKDNNGNSVNLPGSVTSTAPIILFSTVTNSKLLGGNVGVSAGFPFIQNRLQLNSLDVHSSMAYTDTFAGATLGWKLKRADVIAGYNLYMPTGKFEPNGNENSGLGMWGNELTIGSTVFLDQKKMWNAAANFGIEFNSEKRDTNIHPGTTGTVEGGLGKTFYKKVSGPIPMITNLGVVGYAQWKFTHDSGSDIPVALRGLKDYAFALGPEFNIFIPKPRLTFVARYEPEFGAHVRTQGHIFVFSVVWVAKSLVDMPAHP
jgi:hypothetical protein